MRTGKTMSESKDIVVEFSGWVKILNKKSSSGITKKFRKKLKNPLDFNDNYTIIE